MSDTTPSIPGAIPGPQNPYDGQHVAPYADAAPQAQPVTHEATPPVEPTPTPAPAPQEEPDDTAPAPSATRLSPRDRLRQQSIRVEHVNLGTTAEPLWVDVRGLTAGDAFEMGDDFDDDHEPTAAESVPPLLRKTVYLAEDGSRFFDETFSDDDIVQLPMHIVNELTTAANKVLGRTSEPGKD
jgi:hypothetical protein